MRPMQRRGHWSPRGAVLALALSAGLAACDGSDGITGNGAEAAEPRNVRAEYQWVQQGWERGGLRPVGDPAVLVRWELPSEWRGEAFRVYAKRSAEANYLLVATVTSCAEGSCLYTDVNVAPGVSYDYYVATVDQRREVEVPSELVRVSVPATTTPDAPAAPSITGLDGALYLQWPSTGAERYRIFVERVGSDSVFFLVGETDGTAFLDERADNGVTYGYRIAAVDTLGHVSSRGSLGAGVARPDYHAELIWAASDSLEGSGFHFRNTDQESPIVAGDAAAAQWRLEVVDGVLSIRPLGATAVTPGQFTTALTCGPGSEDDCVSVDQAPAASAFSATPVPVEAGNTYVFRVTGADARTHYGKVRIQGVTSGQAGRVAIFDWAYQLQPDTPSLLVGAVLVASSF